MYFFASVRAGLFLGIFCILFLVVSIFDLWLRIDDHALEQKNYFNSLENITTIFLGDSHAALAIDGAELPKDWAHYAYPADNISDMYAKYLYADSLHSIETVVLPVDYQIFTEFRKSDRNICKSPLKNSPAMFVTAYGISPFFYPFLRLRCSLPLLSKVEREKFMINSVRYFLGTKEDEQSMALSPEGTWIFLTEDKTPRDPAGYRRRAEIIADRQIGEPDYSLLRQYNNVVRSMKQRGARVVGIRYPIDYMYLDVLEGRGGEDRDVLDQEINKLDLDLILDYLDIYRGQPALFRNSDHLNRDGAAILTRRIVQDLHIFD